LTRQIEEERRVIQARPTVQRREPPRRTTNTAAAWFDEISGFLKIIIQTFSTTFILQFSFLQLQDVWVNLFSFHHLLLQPSILYKICCRFSCYRFLCWNSKTTNRICHRWIRFEFTGRRWFCTTTDRRWKTGREKTSSIYSHGTVNFTLISFSLSGFLNLFITELIIIKKNWQELASRLLIFFKVISNYRIIQKLSTFCHLYNSSALDFTVKILR